MTKKISLEKLKINGPSTLSDSELLRVFVRNPNKRLLKHGTLTGVMSDKNSPIFLAAHELVKRSLAEQVCNGAILTNSSLVREYLKVYFKHIHREVFTVLFLTKQHHLIACENLFYGTINSASVYPREVVKRALELNAGTVVLAHNHPSGIAEPGQADIRITERIKQSLDFIDVNVLDHLVVGDDIISFAENGLLI